MKEFNVTGLDGDVAAFRCQVSSGTYVRSIAHEIGQKLGCGAHLASLRRTAVAEFGLEHSRTLEQIYDAATQAQIEDLMVHPRRVLPKLPCVTADEETVGKIRHGRAVNLSGLLSVQVGEGVCGAVGADLPGEPGGGEFVPSQGGIVGLGASIVVNDAL